jgi:hypothetical protein
LADGRIRDEDALHGGGRETDVTTNCALALPFRCELEHGADVRGRQPAHGRWVAFSVLHDVRERGVVQDCGALAVATWERTRLVDSTCARHFTTSMAKG